MNVSIRVEKILPFDTCAKGSRVIKVAVMMKGFI